MSFPFQFFAFPCHPCQANGEMDWSCTPGEDPEVTAVRLFGPDDWEPCTERMMPLLMGNFAFMADLRLLIGPVPDPVFDPEPDPLS